MVQMVLGMLERYFDVLRDTSVDPRPGVGRRNDPNTALVKELLIILLLSNCFLCRSPNWSYG